MAVSTKTYRIATIPGDGIGIEVTHAAIQALQTAADRVGSFKIEFQEFPWGTSFYKQTGSYLPDKFVTILKDFDAILFGAVGAADVPDHVSLWGMLLPLRTSLQQYANVRPVRCLTTPKIKTDIANIDWLLVRENSEGEYSGHGGRSHAGQDCEVATDTSIYTRQGIQRIMRLAFESASKRPRQKLTVVSKSNALRHGLVLWDQIAAEVAYSFPNVTWDKELVDAMTVRMVQKPESIDTVVGTNLHIDILSDLAAALAGSIGIAPSANINPGRTYPSMFEPIHGSAFDIAGKGVANPIGAVWAAADMLAWLGEVAAAHAIMEAIGTVCRTNRFTADMGGTLGTKDVAAAICDEISVDWSGKG